jgi:C4-dicarboxylate transporter DctQ subunit
MRPAALRRRAGPPLHAGGVVPSAQPILGEGRALNPFMRSAVDWMRRRAENIVAGLLGIMFVAFILQIVFRYFFNFPIGWTSELSVVSWLYMVLLGSAFWLKESDEIRFDLMSGALGPKGRRVLAFFVALAAIILFGMSLPATVKYVEFMKVESSSYLKIRLDVLYSVYVVFAVAIIVRYAWSLVGILRGEAPEQADITKASSGL